MKVSIIISVYKNTRALALIMQSIAKQTYTLPFEVIVAEDNEGEEMRKAVNEFKRQFSFEIVHLTQPDDGFRKCAILNHAIRVSRAPYLIFIDGDCVLHPRFMEAHLSHQQAQTIVYGRRVMLSEKLTHQLMLQPNLKLNLMRLWLSGSERLDAALYLAWSKPKEKLGFWGHNWSIHKADILAVKGFDEHYTKPGIGEDTDIEWRLQQMGFRFLRIKNKAIQYHLWHKVNYVDTVQVESLLDHKKALWAKQANPQLLMGSL